MTEPQEPMQGDEPRHYDLVVRPPIWRSPRRLAGWAVAGGLALWLGWFAVGWLLDHLLIAIAVVFAVCYLAPGYVRAAADRARASLERRRLR